MYYKITFSLATPLACIEPPIFDGIVAYCYMREKFGEFPQKLNLEAEELIDFTATLPLRVVENNGFKYFESSWLFYEESSAVRAQDSYKKRFDFYNDTIVDFGSKKAQVLINKGDFKSYDIPIELIHTSKCWFYFGSNDVNFVDFLIKKHLYGIGKKTAYGYGRVSAFTIEPCAENPFTKVIRPIPVGEPAPGLAYTAYKPPYWASANYAYCKIK